MTKTEQAYKLINNATKINNMLSVEGLLQDTLGISNSLSFHLDNKTFAEVAQLSKAEVTTTYQWAAVHASIKIGHVEFHYCHNL